MPPDYAKLKQPWQTYLLRLAILPIHVPRTFALTDGDTGSGHLVTWTPVPRMGPNRTCDIGEQLIIYGGDSYVRGGGAATGHTWKIYRYPTGISSDDNYVTNRNLNATDVTATMGTVLDAGKTLQFAPTISGTYAIELHLAGAVEGNGVTAPLGFGVRWVKVPASGAVDLDGVVQLDGPNGSLDEAGVSLRFNYGHPDNVGTGRQSFEPWQRMVAHKRQYYLDPADGLIKEYTFEPSSTFPHSYYANEVLFSGVVEDSSVAETALTHGVDYVLGGAQRILERLQAPLATVSVLGISQTIPTLFFDEAFYQAVIAPEVVEIGASLWLHRVSAMTFSDPALHLLTRHTNFCDWWDLALWQVDTDTFPTVNVREGDLLGWLRQHEGSRFGVMWSDRKSNFFIGPDLNLRGPDYWASAGALNPVIKLDADLYHVISVTRHPPRVGQVVLHTEDVAEALALSEQVKIDEDEVQLVRRLSREAVHPATATLGRRSVQQSVVAFSQAKLDTLAQRFYKAENAEFEVEVEILALPGLDLGQCVELEFNPASNEASMEWHAGGLGTKPFYVAGYQNQVRADGTVLTTRYRLKQITDPP